MWCPHWTHVHGMWNSLSARISSQLRPGFLTQSPHSNSPIARKNEPPKRVHTERILQEFLRKKKKKQEQYTFLCHYMGVSKNRGTPKWDDLKWKSLLTWMIWVVPPLSEAHIWYSNKSRFKTNKNTSKRPRLTHLLQQKHGPKLPGRYGDDGIHDGCIGLHLCLDIWKLKMNHVDKPNSQTGDLYGCFRK